MEKQLYPAWRYHKDGRSLIVQTEAEADALESGWGETPPNADPRTTPATGFAPGHEPPVAHPTTPGARSATPASTPIPADDVVLEGTVAEVKETIDRLLDPAGLKALRTAEVHGKHRAGVLAAIDARLDTLNEH